MSKTKSEWILKHYPPLREIPLEDWDHVFSRQPYPWDDDEDDYLRRWYDKESTMDLAFALERCPWSVQQRGRKLGLRGKVGGARREA